MFYNEDFFNLGISKEPKLEKAGEPLNPYLGQIEAENVAKKLPKKIYYKQHYLIDLETVFISRFKKFYPKVPPKDVEILKTILFDVYNQTLAKVTTEDNIQSFNRGYNLAYAEMCGISDDDCENIDIDDINRQFAELADEDYAYNKAYNEGYEAGYSSGYEEGYQKGLYDCDDQDSLEPEVWDYD